MNIAQINIRTHANRSNPHFSLTVRMMVAGILRSVIFRVQPSGSIAAVIPTRSSAYAGTASQAFEYLEKYEAEKNAKPERCAFDGGEKRCWKCQDCRDSVR